MTWILFQCRRSASRSLIPRSVGDGYPAMELLRARAPLKQMLLLPRNRVNTSIGINASASRKCYLGRSVSNWPAPLALPRLCLLVAGQRNIVEALAPPTRLHAVHDRCSSLDSSSKAAAYQWLAGILNTGSKRGTFAVGILWVVPMATMVETSAGPNGARVALSNDRPLSTAVLAGLGRLKRCLKHLICFGDEQRPTWLLEDCQVDVPATNGLSPKSGYGRWFKDWVTLIRNSACRLLDYYVTCHVYLLAMARKGKSKSHSAP